MSYEFFVRPLREDEILCHKCDNPPCVNPEHLFPGTQADNVADMMEKSRNYQGPSKAPGTLHPSAKLTEEIAREIRASVLGVRTLANKFGVSKSLIHGIKKGTHWKYA